MGTEPLHGEVEDRPLTERELDRIKRGVEPTGKGSYVPFNELPPETLREYQRRAMNMRRMKREAKRLAELDAYMEAHREHFAMLLGAKLTILTGLMDEMRCADPQTGEEVFDTRLLDEKRLGVLMSIIDKIEKSGKPAKAETAQRVDVVHHIVELTKQLKRD